MCSRKRAQFFAKRAILCHLGAFVVAHAPRVMNLEMKAECGLQGGGCHPKIRPGAVDLVKAGGADLAGEK